jgi:hypothetical protein
MTITTTIVTVLRRFEYLAEKVMYADHYNAKYIVGNYYSYIKLNKTYFKFARYS